MAETLAGYFRHEEPKSVGETGELKRRVIVSLDKHFIRKETNPLDDDNEDAQDDEPIVTSSDLILRSGDRNLQPLIDAGIKFRRGKRLTLAEMETIKSRTKLMEDGSLVAQGAVEDGYIGGYVSDPEWAARLKTWRQLNKLGRFMELAKQAGVPVSTIEDAARYGNYDDKCEETDWGSIQAAIDVLTGRAKRRAKLRRARQKAGERVLTQRSRRKVATLLNEIQAADSVVFPTEILNSSMIEEDEGGDEMQDGLAIVSPEYTPPAVEYWEPPARRQRARTAAALRVARHRKRKNDTSS